MLPVNSQPPIFRSITGSSHPDDPNIWGQVAIIPNSGTLNYRDSVREQDEARRSAWFHLLMKGLDMRSHSKRDAGPLASSQRPVASRPTQKRRNRALSKIDRINVAHAVEKGATFLDRRIGKWASRIDLAALDQSSIEYCILSQLFGSYGRGSIQLRLKRKRFEYGFSSKGPAATKDATNAWRAAVGRRLT